MPAPNACVRAEGRSSASYFFGSSFAWNVALGMAYLLTPLYAGSLGMSGVQIGTLLAAPVLLQFVFTLLGGAMTDHFGGRNMALASCLLVCAAGLVFLGSSGFLSMLLGQVLMVTARTVFWPAAWSLASQLPGDSARHMGMLNSVTNGGQVVGVTAAGFTITNAGYAYGFGSMIGLGLFALALTRLFRLSGGKVRQPAPPMLATYGALVGRRSIRFSMLCSFIATLPLSLSSSFLPILLLAHGLQSDLAGLLISLRAIGAVAVGFFVAYAILQVPRLAAPLVSALVVAATIAAPAATTQPVLIGILLLALGAASGMMMIYFQMLISAVSTPTTRGSAMALGTLGGNFSHLMIPLVMGYLTDYFGIRDAFYVIGVLALLSGAAIVPLHRRAFAVDAAPAG